MKTTKENEIIIFKTKEGPSVDVYIKDETVWLTQSEMAELFKKNRNDFIVYETNTLLGFKFAPDYFSRTPRVL